MTHLCALLDEPMIGQETNNNKKNPKKIVVLKTKYIAESNISHLVILRHVYVARYVYVYY